MIEISAEGAEGERGGAGQGGEGLAAKFQEAVDAVVLALDLLDLRRRAHAALDDGEKRAGDHAEDGQGDDDLHEGEGAGWH